ncbi:MAG: M23 family metallopeptidase [Acaryochloridaceae cyanobacterium CSU_5_19]|nr:M23 family metallopeptidase [Acaryochloridaceae cyanobacterium CSU_5_19]
MGCNRWLSVLSASLLVLGVSTAIGKAAEEEQPPQLTARGPSIWNNGSFPVENFQGYTSPFGYRISPTGGYSTEFHSGLDFAAPTGSSIRSWWAGRVVDVSDHTACGTSVRIQSGSWIHVYCHMQGYVSSGEMVDGGLRIRKGQLIRAGERIGQVGMTGRTTGPHLHWTLKYQGKLVDPAAVLRAMYGAQRGVASNQL